MPCIFLTFFSFKKQEQYFNTYDHYLTNIEGIDIHFLHVKPKLDPGQKAKPLLISHGWPGSFYEFYKVNSCMITDKYGQFLRLADL